MTSADAFLEARNLLLSLRSDRDRAYREFRWPALDRFNWALDYFDRYAEGNDRPALWIQEEDGTEVRLSFAELAERSNRVANFLRRQGARPGDRVLLMLPNVVPIWESMLACIKLGVVLVPATTQLTPDDLRDRFERGGVRHVITEPAGARKFDELPGESSRVVTGEVDGWTPFAEADQEDPDF